MLANSLRDVRTAIISLAVFTALCGLAYPYAMTGLSQALFSRQANGSLVKQNGEVVGSSLVGQNFSSPAYFHPRPSAAGADGYDGGASSGSNLGPSSQALADRVAADVARVREENGLSADAEVPVDAVTASASGLDPHISPAYADLQVARVASKRGASEEQVRALVEDSTDTATLGVFGEPRVNILKLNLALDDTFGAP
jgi:K+-transporting ATPase ATPase C chain